MRYQITTLFAYFFILLFALVILSCEKNDDLYTPDEGEPTNSRFIDPDFIPYVNSFIEEGAKRGVSIDIANINMIFSESTMTNGECGGGQVRIKKSVWETQDDCYREYLVFHELGHCALDRGHRNDTIYNNWVSIMRGNGIGYPKQNIEPLFLFGKYKTYYIDELFDE